MISKRFIKVFWKYKFNFSNLTNKAKHVIYIKYFMKYKVSNQEK